MQVQDECTAPKVRTGGNIDPRGRSAGIHIFPQLLQFRVDAIELTCDHIHTTPTHQPRQDHVHRAVFVVAWRVPVLVLRSAPSATFALAATM